MSTEVVKQQETQTFNFNGIELTVILNEQNEPLFIGKAVCDILGIKNVPDAMSKLDDDEKLLSVLPIAGQNRSVNLITESGLYSLILKSRKAEAKVFKKWVTSEVLPSIRKHGAYMTPGTIENILTDPEFIIQLATKLKDEKEKVKVLTETIEVQKPMVEFAEALQGTNTSILVGEMATILKQNGIDIGQNRLYAYLRDNGFVISKKCEQYNLPTQKSLNAGLLEVKTKVITKKASDGSEYSFNNNTTKVTVRGQEYFIKHFKKRNALAVA